MRKSLYSSSSKRIDRLTPHFCFFFLFFFLSLFFLLLVLGRLPTQLHPTIDVIASSSVRNVVLYGEWHSVDTGRCAAIWWTAQLFCLCASILLIVHLVKYSLPLQQIDDVQYNKFTLLMLAASFRHYIHAGTATDIIINAAPACPECCDCSAQKKREWVRILKPHFNRKILFFPLSFSLIEIIKIKYVYSYSLKKMMDRVCIAADMDNILRKERKIIA